ncbi:hypothetical protein [uncultured Ilumatobacter sp.]|jgi:hypothetical protein|uniref:hypothetical protein n=1 Tax=uncultured Ilumatobacter sp. TaxID=879968 RepID=UPI00374EB4F8
MGEVDRTPERGSQEQGELIVRGNVIGTAIFVATAVFAAAVFTTTAQWVGASIAMALFAVGVFAFLWGFWNAVQRSRDEEVSVTQLYMLLGAGTPKKVRRTMLLMLCIQVVAAFGTAIWRIDGPDGSPGSSLAVGLLVPMFGLGLNGLWAAYHAEFGKRMDPEAVAGRTGTEQERVDSGADVSTSTTSIDQNEAHG